MQQRWKTRRIVGAAALLAALAWGEPTALRAEEPATAPPAVGLDRLLAIPDDVPLDTGRRGGATRSEWRARFHEAELDLEAARKALAEVQRELEEVAAGTEAWQLAAPGAQPGADAGNSPLSFRLRQEIRRQREEVERAERRLQELSVEANLAGVPREWQTGGEKDEKEGDAP